MSAEKPKFDPYFKWLGIPRREQPPNHYRLLGIAMYEADPQVIDAAAQRQARFIQECGESKFADVAVKLIEQVAAARACLFDAQAKAAYDEELKNQQPKSPVKGPRKTRFDALQVSHVDTPIKVVDSQELLPVPGQVQAAVEEEEVLPDLSVLSLVGEEDIPNPAVTGKQATSLGPVPQESPRATPEAVLPPVVQRSSGDSDVNTGTVVKLALGGCILAGGITWGVLTWLSSKNAQPAHASVAADHSPSIAAKPSTAPIAAAMPAATATQPAAAPGAPQAPAKPASATQPAPKPAAQASTPTSAPAKPAAAAPATPAAPAQAPAAPKPQPPANPFAGTTWQVATANTKWVITLHADGALTTEGSPDRGTWKSENGMITGQVARQVIQLRPISDKEMKGMLTGAPASATLVKPRASVPAPAAPKPAAPGAAPAAPAAPPDADDAEETANVQQSEWVLPFRNLRAFRNAWLRGPETTTIDYDPDTRVVALEGADQLGGFQHQRPWREIHLTLHAETITGQLEIQVNDTTLKFATATALIRRPATVVITFDEPNSRLIASVGTRQVARATVLSDKFLSTLNCQLRCDGGKTRMKVNELKIKTR